MHNTVYIYEEFWSAEEIISCCPSARLLLIGMAAFCDEKDLHPSSMKTIKSRIFPCEDISDEDIKKWINQLLENNLIEEHDTKYLVIQSNLITFKKEDYV